MFVLQPVKHKGLYVLKKITKGKSTLMTWSNMVEAENYRVEKKLIDFEVIEINNEAFMLFKEKMKKDINEDITLL